MRGLVDLKGHVLAPKLEMWGCSSLESVRFGPAFSFPATVFLTDDRRQTPLPRDAILSCWLITSTRELTLRELHVWFEHTAALHT